ncbi:caprin-2-like isoform X4 [Xiphophorus couchianus]|uniref:caprin-2-like isoform X4 n=1 Tax=Xiphophorus couchianus TaxID=32473 RepID=UPI001016811C|nr:caprin-2-like isoform X4 [Xiphophorus couchianus]
MTFSVWLLVCFCGLTLGQNVFTQTDVATETGSCFPDMCKFLKEFGAMKAKLEAVETNLKEKSEALETRQTETENQVLELKKKDATIIAFSAATGGSGHIGPFDTDTTLIYRKLIINVGNAYNQHTGIFVAPVRGIYYFSFFYHFVGRHQVVLRLMKNNESLLESSGHMTMNDGADNGGNAAFLELQQGDQVYVQLEANCEVWGDSYTTTFSGFLLHKV